MNKEEMFLTSIKDEGNFWVIQLKPSTRYVKYRIQKDRFGKGVYAGWGIRKDGKVELWAIKFSKKVFKTKDDVRKWIKSHPKIFGNNMTLSLRENIELECIPIGYEELDDKKIKVTAVALAEGTWHGIFYPFSEIKESANRLKGKRTMVLHGRSERYGDKQFGTIHKVTVDKTIKGIISEVIETDKSLIKDIKNNRYKGVSVGVCFFVVEHKNKLIAVQLDYKELSYTNSPACTKCLIKSKEVLSNLSNLYKEDMKPLNTECRMEKNTIDINEEELSKEIINTIRKFIEKRTTEYDTETGDMKTISHIEEDVETDRKVIEDKDSMSMDEEVIEYFDDGTSGICSLADEEGFLSDESMEKLAKWTRKYINDLPDSAFAYIEPGGKKDKEGKTVPRRLRHLPYKDHNGKIDVPHLRNAIARLPHTKLPEKAKKAAFKKLYAAAKKVGVAVSDEVKKKYLTEDVHTDVECKMSEDKSTPEVESQITPEDTGEEDTTEKEEPSTPEETPAETPTETKSTTTEPTETTPTETKETPKEPVTEETPKEITPKETPKEETTPTKEEPKPVEKVEYAPDAEYVEQLPDDVSVGEILVTYGKAGNKERGVE